MKKMKMLFYYITTMNENYTHPEKPKDEEIVKKECIYLKNIERKAKLKFSYWVQEQF